MFFNLWTYNPRFIIESDFKSRAGYNGACTVDSLTLGAVHKRCQQFGVEEGSKFGQNGQWIVLKNCQHGEGGCLKSVRIADVAFMDDP